MAVFWGHVRTIAYRLPKSISPVTRRGVARRAVMAADRRRRNRKDPT